MSEPKRATLSTISTQKGDVKKVKEKSKTVRFSLTLAESNEKSCPEYHYRDLLNSAEKKNKAKDKSQGQENGLNHLDPFDEDDADVKRIAKQFEAKYGIPKKKRRGKKDDYADIGAGYDESDSFIDNTDAYDEMVPEDVTTVHGGFYINSGALEFKHVELSGSESSDSEASQKITSRKRIIEDTDESDSENENDETNKKEENKPEHVEKKQKIETNGIQKPPAKKKLILTDDKEALLKKKKIEENLLKKKPITVKDLLREKREEFDMTIEPETPQKDVTAAATTAATTTTAAVVTTTSATVKPPNSSTIIDVIESVINAGRGDNIDETSKDSSSSDDVAVVSAASSESESSRDGLPPNLIPEQLQSEAPKLEPEIPIVKLPENVPSIVLEIINNIKKAAENSEGKVKFFSGSVNNMLLSLEMNTRKLVKSNRIQIYEHLAPFVKCKKDTLIRRAKNLVFDHERSKLKDPLLRLRAIVDNLMPIVKKSYEKECQKIRDEMFLASANANAENGDVNSKIRRIPRKKFPWSEEARKTLQEIIFVKKKCLTLEGIRKETFEAKLESFLKTVVLPIWPEGWITITALNKQAKVITETSPKQKMRKVIPPMSPISLDIHATTISPAVPYHSPVKNISPSCATGISGITVIPIPQSNSMVSPKAASSSIINGPKPKHHSPSDLSVSINRKTDSALNMSAEICAIPTTPKECSNNNSSLLIPSSKSNVTITSVDLRTTNSNNSFKKEDELLVSVSENVTKTIEVISKCTTPVPPAPIVKPTNLKQRILSEISSSIATPKLSTPRVENNDECQIIDLTDSPVVIRKPGPKSKTRNADGSLKLKRVKESSERIVKNDDGIVVHRKPEEITGSQALNQIITGLTTKYGTNSGEMNVKPSTYKDNAVPASVNEDEMEQVMKDLKELQQLQEHARKNDIDIMAPSSSPVSVIAFNSSYSPSRMQPNDLSTSKDRKLNSENQGFQDIFQKHLFQEAPLLKSSQSSSVYNSNVQPKNSYNSINNFSYASTGSISNTMNNIRYSQNANKFASSMNHLPTTPTGPKQKSPP